MKKIISMCLSIILGFIAGVIFMIYRCGYILEREKKKADKYFTYFNFWDRWLMKKEQGYNYAEYFREHDIKTVAIYGMGQIGRHLKYELENVGVRVAYVIDEGEKIIYGSENHYNLQDALPFVDLVIVTPIEEFEEIKNRILDNNRLLNVISVDKMLVGN